MNVLQVKRVTMAVHRRGTHILHALLYDPNFQLLAEHQVPLYQAEHLLLVYEVFS
jgi:hypothetical protein